ncbi:CGNR zinc finger domain-containing protein [Streptomyces sp. FZ201]|uniref:CGNR zinc finger domain-containing protein n=1 Tax=Streptomyces sp. FZ201 TaxID=3057122 RepID=UPI0021BF1ED1|nr:CGNR zinc finger domain-containing protein [Streptomyces sp. FZ201]
MLEPPPCARLVEEFANTVDVEEASDEISTPDALARWLRDRKLSDLTVQISPAAHGMYLALRAGIRDELGTHVGDAPDPELTEAADEVLRAHPVLVTASGTLTVAPGLPVERQPLAALAIAWNELVMSGSANRLKRCAEHTCGWVFWDVSKNRSRRWCSMRVCGNRNKSRAYAGRQRELRRSQP